MLLRTTAMPAVRVQYRHGATVGQARAVHVVHAVHARHDTRAAAGQAGPGCGGGAKHSAAAHEGRPLLPPSLPLQCPAARAAACLHPQPHPSCLRPPHPLGAARHQHRRRHPAPHAAHLSAPLRPGSGRACPAAAGRWGEPPAGGGVVVVVVVVVGWGGLREGCGKRSEEGGDGLRGRCRQSGRRQTGVEKGGGRACLVAPPRCTHVHTAAALTRTQQRQQQQQQQQQQAAHNRRASGRAALAWIGRSSPPRRMRRPKARQAVPFHRCRRAGMPECTAVEARYRREGMGKGGGGRRQHGKTKGEAVQQALLADTGTQRSNGQAQSAGWGASRVRQLRYCDGTGGHGISPDT